MIPYALTSGVYLHPLHISSTVQAAFDFLPEGDVGHTTTSFPHLLSHLTNTYLIFLLHGCQALGDELLVTHKSQIWRHTTADKLIRFG